MLSREKFQHLLVSGSLLHGSPVVWQNEKSKDYFTISSGKVVSFDASGRIVPSGLLRSASDAGALNTTILEYRDSIEKDARVIDITTGKFVTGNRIVDLEGFANAIRNNGWSTAAAPQGGAAGLAEAKAIVKAFISAPVGVAAYDVYCWAGDDPANLHYTNYQKQHLIQFFTDIQMRVPHVCKKDKDADLIQDPAAAQQLTGVVLGGMPRYAGLDMTNVVAYRATSAFASNTSRTPIGPLQNTDNVDWVGRERSEIALQKMVIISLMVMLVLFFFMKLAEAVFHKTQLLMLLVLLLQCH